MNAFSFINLVHVVASFSIVISPLLVRPAIAQQTPSDVKLLHDVNTGLQNENAFRGLVIVLKVSHGIVTLTCRVSIEGDKVLASMELGQVDGVKTVLNKLKVRSCLAPADKTPALANPSGAQSQQLTEEPHSRAPRDLIAKTITIPVHTPIQVRLSDPITTKTAKADDQFHGVLAAAVYQDRVVAIPGETPVLGRVVSAKAAGHFIPLPSSPLS